MRIKKNILKYKNPTTGEYNPIPVVATDGVTKDSIEAALGYVPADEEDVSELNEKLVQLDNSIFDVEISGEKNYYRDMHAGACNNNGVFSVDSYNQYTEFIPVKKGDYVVVSYINQNDNQTMASNKINFVAIFDEYKNVAGNSGGKTGNNYFLVPSGVSYVILTLSLPSATAKDFQIEINTEPSFTSFEKYEVKKDLKETVIDKYIRQQIYINVSDTEEQILDKLYQAYSQGDTDVIWEYGNYNFSTVFDLIKTKHNRVNAFELPVGNGCAYYFNNSTIIGTKTSTDLTVQQNESLFGSWRKGGNYEMYDGTLIGNGLIYCVHDEVNDEPNHPYIRKYNNMKMYLNSDEDYSTYDKYNLRKCVGGGGGVHGQIIIDKCVFINDYDNDDVSYHGLNKNDTPSVFKVECYNSYLQRKIGLGSLGTNQTGELIYSGNTSRYTPTGTNWNVIAWQNEKRTS